jgi:phosphoglycolate phosphatase
VKPEAIAAVLFDLDGTLVDTAPDLGAALNRLRAEHDLPPLPAAHIRPQASHGARGLLEIGFQLAPGHPDFEPMRERLLDLYADYLYCDSRLFDGIAALLTALEARKIPWGVVTNKPARFTTPLLELMGLSARAAAVIAGDTCSHPKPHPAPMFEAARRCGVAPERCLYLGDAERDIQAAKNAAMPALVAAWGYLDRTDTPETWGADAIIQHPADTLKYL